MNKSEISAAMKSLATYRWSKVKKSDRTKHMKMMAMEAKKLRDAKKAIQNKA